MGGASVIITGTLKPDGTLALDEKPGLRPGRVIVRVEAEAQASTHTAKSFFAAMKAVWAETGQSEMPLRGAAQIDEEIGALRREFDQRLDEIDRLQHKPGREQES